jgi:hypothetical protein
VRALPGQGPRRQGVDRPPRRVPQRRPAQGGRPLQCCVSRIVSPRTGGLADADGLARR